MLHLRRVPVAHDLGEEHKVFVVVQRGTRLQVPIPGRLVIALDERIEGPGGNDFGLILGCKDIGVFFPELRRSKLAFELPRRPAPPLEVDAVLLAVDMLR